MTRIAEGLAKSRSVNVLCSQPTYAARGTRAPSREEHNGVCIERCWSTALSKDFIPFRLINLLTISASMFFSALIRLRRDDIVLVVTNPPLLPFAISTVCRLKGAKCILRIDDVYPNVLVSTGVARPESLIVRIMERLTRRLYGGVQAIVVLGRDMAALVRSKLPDIADRITVIPNWADLDLVSPHPKSENALLSELGLKDKFVVQCAGNMGRAQGIDTMFAAAEILRDNDQVHFLFIGSGARRPWMEQQVRDKNMRNVTLVDQRPRSDQPNFLNACDAAMASLVPGMLGVSVPSRMYNIMAAGRPIIAITEPGSEMALVVEEEHIGWVVPPDDAAALAEAISDACRNPSLIAEMGARARIAAETKYSEEHAVAAYLRVVEELTEMAEETCECARE